MPIKCATQGMAKIVFWEKLSSTTVKINLDQIKEERCSFHIIFNLENQKAWRLLRSNSAQRVTFAPAPHHSHCVIHAQLQLYFLKSWKQEQQNMAGQSNDLVGKKTLRLWSSIGAAHEYWPLHRKPTVFLWELGKTIAGQILTILTYNTSLIN